MASPSAGRLCAVWSLWSKPFERRARASWPSLKHHLLAWVLSFESARRHYPETRLVTDSAGARLLLDGLGLPFAHVSTALDALDDQDPNWWALGKLHAYRAQAEPFVHIDTDVFLWKPLPERLERAAVFAQSPEPFRPGASYYRPEEAERALGYPEEGWLPEEWVWYRSARPDGQRGDCCGIFGGTRLDFIRHYADLALRLIGDPSNRRGWAGFDEKVSNIILVEQYLLAACVEYHRASPASPFSGVHMEHLFASSFEMYSPEVAARAGYTHLIGNAKRNPTATARLENRVRFDYPEHYERCLRFLADAPAGCCIFLDL